MRSEPVVVTTIVRALITLAAAFGLITFTEMEAEAVLAAITAAYVAIEGIMAAYTRARVYSPETIERTGAINMIPERLQVD